MQRRLAAADPPATTEIEPPVGRFAWLDIARVEETVAAGDEE
jgi:hypothetical protein